MKIRQFTSLSAGSTDPLIDIVALLGCSDVRISLNMHAVTLNITEIQRGTFSGAN